MTEVSGHSKHVVLASDATYFYEEFEADRPFWLCCDLLATYRSLDLFRELDRRGRLDRARPGGGRNEASVGRWPGWRGDHRADGPLAYNTQPDSCGAAGRFPINDPSTSRRGRSNESCCCSAGLARPDGSSGAGSGGSAGATSDRYEPWWAVIRRRSTGVGFGAGNRSLNVGGPPTRSVQVHALLWCRWFTGRPSWAATVMPLVDE